MFILVSKIKGCRENGNGNEFKPMEIPTCGNLWGFCGNPMGICGIQCDTLFI